MEGGPGPNQFDTVPSATSRFGVELIAWIAGPWAAADITGSAWAAIPAVLILLALPSVFSTPGDKHQVIVATPGGARLVIELLLHAVAIVGAWIVWPPWAAMLSTLTAGISLVSGMPRARWLAKGAGPFE